MSNWDDDDWDTVPEPSNPPPVGGFGVGNWDDEDLEDPNEDPDKDLKKPSAPMKPSTLRAKKIKEKEEAELKRAAEKALAQQKELDELDAVERKLRQRQIVEEADFENTKDLFMGGGSKEGMLPPAEPTLDTFSPKTDADYKKFVTMVGEKCCMLNDNPRKTGRYVTFVKDLMRVLTRDLGPDDTKDLSAHMGIIGNEKRDEFKKSKGFKKKTNKKAHVRVDRAADMRDDNFDDFADDFM